MAVAGTSSAAVTRSLLRGRPAADLLALALRSRHDTVLGALVDSAGLGGAAGVAADPDAVREQILAGAGLPESSLVPGRTLPFTTALATAWAGMGRSQDEQVAGVEVFGQVLERRGHAGLTAPEQRHVLQAAYLTGRHDLVQQWLPRLPRVTPAVASGLRADLANPVVGGPGALPLAEWEVLLGERFTSQGLTRPRVDQVAEVLFDGLHLEPGASVDGPLVTVIVPAFRPDAGLLTSVRSMLAQTHGHLEILLVDDCSGPDFEDVFAQAEALDPRVRLLRQERNGGSYLGRNAALRIATGEFVTTQDADDWSHPDRIARQVALMRERPEAAGSRSAAIRARPDLTRQWFGYSPERMNASALMVRRDLLERIGGFDPIRKGADSELHERLSLLGGVVDVVAPLAITRLAAGSLSRADFSFGRHSPERVLFRSAFRHWHEQLAASTDPEREPGLGAPLVREGQHPYPVPRGFVRALPHAQVPRTAYRLVVLADQARPWPPELADLLRDGVAVLGREDLTRSGAEVAGWSPSLLDAAREGRVDLLTDADEVEAETLVVLEPSLLAFPALPLPALRPGRVVVAAVPPGEGEPVRDLEAAGQTVREAWGRAPIWVARTPDEQERWAREGWHVPLLEDAVEMTSA